MEKRRRINGYILEWNDDCNCYECRGEVCYDDEHDETPDPKLWEATLKLEAKLKEEGHNAEADYSEKGWQEVTVYNDN